MNNHNTETFAQLNRSDPQLTVRAILTGVLLGTLLTPCNVYSGLKIGWSFNMSITAALLSLAFWKALAEVFNTRPWGMLENNINQTTASSAASIISGGLVAPIPAYTMLTGKQLPWSLLSFWVFAVSALGIVVAVGLRQQMLLRDPLRFPAGVATAETVKEIYAKGQEGKAKIKVLFSALSVSAGLKLFSEWLVFIPKLVPAWMLSAKGALPASGITQVSFKNLGFVLDPSLLMVGFGAIIGIRAGLALLLGAILAWGVLAPWVLAKGWVTPGAPDEFWFATLVEWLLWPGVTLMVVASLISFGFSVCRMWKKQVKAEDKNTSIQKSRNKSDVTVPLYWFWLGFVITVVIATLAQMSLFNIALWEALFAIAMSFVLAIVAARVSGETGITPIGAMGKITQFTFGMLTPGNITNNLMTANVTGGAAGQCADLLHDFKTGLLIGATPRFQAVAQIFGVLTGSLVGTATYLILIPDPSTMLITQEWPAPAVATWKAVAEILSVGIEAAPIGSLIAMVIAAIAAVILAIAANLLPKPIKNWIPSASAMGLAFVIPAWNSISIFIGALLGLGLTCFFPKWTTRFLMALAAGLVAGESIAGVAAVAAKFIS